MFKSVFCGKIAVFVPEWYLKKASLPVCTPIMVDNSAPLKEFPDLISTRHDRRYFGFRGSTTPNPNCRSKFPIIHILQFLGKIEPRLICHCKSKRRRDFLKTKI